MRLSTGIWLAVLTTTSVGLAAGCSSRGDGKGLSVSATAVTGAAGGASVASIDAGNGLSIDRLRLVVRKFEIEAEDGAACPLGPSGPTGPTGTTGPTGPTGPSGAVALHGDSGSGSGSGSSGHGGDDDGMDDHEDECEIEAGPFLVDLSGNDLANGVHWVASVDVPAGTYEELKFKINTINAQQAGGDAGLLEMAEARASILVNGTRSGGAAFTFALPLEVLQKREGTIVVDPATGANVTLDIDPSGWFKAADGSLLDPDDATARGAIIQNVKASIRVMHDDDGDGHDDDGDDRGGGHGGGADDPQPHG